MAATEPAPPAELVLKPCWRAFFVYHVAIVICLFGPRINPDVWFFGVFHFTVTVGTVLGLILIGLVVYLKMGREYCITPQGLTAVWRWPSPQKQMITWENLGNIEIRRGLVQTILRVGNLAFLDKSGGQAMLWFGVPYPKEVRDVIEGRRP